MIARFVASFAIALPLLTPLPPPITPGPSVGPAPDIPAEAWIVIDSASGLVLAGNEIDTPRPMASVTKILTAIVVVENTDPDDVVTISSRAANVGESEIGVVQGERWTVGDLLIAMIVRSGNDAAFALAEYVGGSIDGFAAMMNAEASALGLKNSHFTNPHGLDDDAHYTTPFDLSVIAKAAIGYPSIAAAARVRIVQFADDPLGNERIAVATNRLLGTYPGVVGLKTGYTSKANKVLVTVARTRGREIITVVMGSEDHFSDTTELLAWAYETFGPSERLLALALPEQGGSGDFAYPPGLPADVIARLAGIKPLESASGPPNEFQNSALADEIEAWIRLNIAVSVGGAVD